jgi:uncharacterized protein YozE (UPF0346 family)
MGSSAFFHSSSKFYQRHQASLKTGRLRIEESNYFLSVADEEEFLNRRSNNSVDAIARIIEQEGKQHIRMIPFDQIWSTFWSSVKSYYFLFRG